MAFFPRFAAGEFAPLFRLLDDYASHSLTRDVSPSVSQLRSFQPRFDVREVKDAYELQGELPGISNEDINIEFTDAQTLTIKGRSERSKETGTKPTTAAIAESTTSTATATPVPTPDASETSSNYHKASVEEDEANTSSAAEQDKGKAPADSAVEATQANAVEKTQTEAPAPQHRYWVSERSVGEFSRTFNFPNRVDQESVKASLKNGILSIVVPKATAPASRRIVVE